MTDVFCGTLLFRLTPALRALLRGKVLLPLVVVRPSNLSFFSLIARSFTFFAVEKIISAVSSARVWVIKFLEIAKSGQPL